jgi:hypothetical protein
MVMLDTARRKFRVPALARWLIGLGIAANVAHGRGMGRSVPQLRRGPAVALVGSYEFLMMAIRSSQAALDGVPGEQRASGPAAGADSRGFRRAARGGPGPSVRAIRASLHVGQPRARRLRDCLAAGAKGRRETALPSGRPVRGARKLAGSRAAPDSGASRSPRHHPDR